MRENKKKENFFTKRGFFIVIVIAVSLMVIALVMNLVNSGERSDRFDDEAWESAVRQSAEKSQDVYREKAQTVNSTATPATAKPGLAPMISEDTSKKENQIEDAAAEPAVTAAPQTGSASSNQGISLILEKPVAGEIAKDFSADELVYFETMQDWRVHEGIDFAVDENTEVKAAADGTVEAVNADGMLGASVIIGHTGGIKTLYANLTEDSAPPVGTAVKAGDVIGKVGKTAALEINDSPHLHFEVIENEKSVNPHNFFEKAPSEDAE